jgi:hypothetical protein
LGQAFFTKGEWLKMTLAAILLMMRLLAGRDDVHDARAIAGEILQQAGSLHEAAVLVDTAWRESAFRASVVSRDGRDLCAYQLRDAPRIVLSDLVECTERAIAKLRSSAEACPEAPLAAYATGTCSDPRGRRLSGWRMREVARIERAAADSGL